MNKKIKVLKKHIDQCKNSFYDETNCPIALALEDNGYEKICVLDPEVSIYIDINYEHYNYPKSARNFVKAFDRGERGKRIKPFTFILKPLK